MFIYTFNTRKQTLPTKKLKKSSIAMCFLIDFAALFELRRAFMSLLSSWSNVYSFIHSVYLLFAKYAIFTNVLM